MKTIGNLIWFLLVGLWSAIGFILGGIVLCISIIGIPFGLQCFKLAELMIWPFGKEPKIHFERHPIANIIWLIFMGIEQFIGFTVVGLILCITIIGIPFGLQCFKLATLGALPFGAEV